MFNNLEPLHTLGRQERCVSALQRRDYTLHHVATFPSHPHHTLCTLNTDVYYTLAAKKPDSLIMGLENTIEQ